MSTEKTPWKPWGDHPIVVLIFLIAALIPIAIFIRGNLENTPDSINSTIIIRVATEAGDSVPGAKAIALYPNGGLSQYTDVNGTVSFNLPISNLSALRIIVEAEGFEIYELQIQQLPSDIVNVRLDERKGERADVILRVVDSETETPISNAEITLVSNGDLFKEISDSDGFAQFTLDFPVEGKIDTQIGVSADKYKIENQIRTLLPGKLQYVLLSSDSLSIKIPVIPTSIQSSVDNQIVMEISTSESLPNIVDSVAIGSGVEISQTGGGSGLRVSILRSDSLPWEGVYVEAYEQVADVTGNPALGKRVKTGYVNQQGFVDFDLGDGTFAVCVDSTGYGWTERDCIYTLNVKSDSLTSLQLQPGQLEVAIAGAIGEPWQGVYYEIYTQKKDVNGNPVIDQRVASGYTDNAGFGRETLTPGMYAISLDLRGYNWGNMVTGKGQLNIAIEKGKSNRVAIEMGELIIGLRNSAGEPAANVYIEIYTQAKDINGQQIIADRIWSGYTDIGGLAEISLTNGLYALKVEEKVLYDILVEGGKTTETDGDSFNQK